MTDLAAIRYDLIAPLLWRYRRRFTLLDLGAGVQPYMAQRISTEFDCVTVAIEQDVITPYWLQKFGPRTLWLRKAVSAEDLARLSCCERFDVAMALNFLHHSVYWRESLSAIDRMVDHAIVQTPHPDDSQTCGRELAECIHPWVSVRGECIGESVQFDGHRTRPIYSLRATGSGLLSMSSWTSPPDCIKATIRSNFDVKYIELAHKVPMRGFRPYIHGLNLWNFAHLGGAWPRKDAVLQLIREFPLPAEHHGDITPHNFLFDGAELHLIDGHEGWEFDDAAGLKKTEEMVGDLLK